MTPQTPTEILAQKLFGWEPYKPNANYSHCRCYRKGWQWEGIRIADGSRYCENENWPDFANWNDIHRMEDKLRELGHADHYVVTLYKLVWLDNYEFAKFEQPDWVSLRFATAEQCLAAAVRVCEEAGL